MNNISENQSSSNNTKRPSSLLSTSSSLRKKNIKLGNELSSFNNLYRINTTKKIQNIPISIPLFSNNSSLNENYRNLYLNRKHKLNLKIESINKKLNNIKSNKKIISRNISSFLLNTLTPKNSFTKSSLQNNYKIPSLRSESNPIIKRLNNPPLNKLHQQSLLKYNKISSISIGTFEKELSTASTQKNIFNKMSINRKKYILSPLNSETFQREKISKKINRKTESINNTNNNMITNNLYTSKNSIIIKEIKSIINGKKAKKNQKFTFKNNQSEIFITNKNDYININEIIINKNENISINGNNLNKNNNANNNEKYQKINENINNICENNNNIVQDNNNISIINNQKKKEIDIKSKILEKIQENTLKKEIKQINKKEKEKKVYFNIEKKKHNQAFILHSSTQNDLEKIKKNKFYLVINNKKSKNIYENNSFLNGIHKESINNSINMKLFIQKSKMIINNKEKANKIINYEKNKLKNNNYYIKKNTLPINYFKNQKRDIENYPKIIIKNNNLFKCNLCYTLKKYIFKTFEFNSLSSIPIINESKNHNEIASKIMKDFKYSNNYLKIQSKFGTIYDFNLFNLININDIILKSFPFYKEEHLNNNKIIKKIDINKRFNKKISKILKYKTNSPKNILNSLNNQFSINSKSIRNLNKNSINTILNLKKHFKYEKLKFNELNIYNYSILNKKNFFKIKENSVINEKENEEEINNIDEIYLKLIKLIIERKSKDFINYYEKNKELININEEILNGNSLLILSIKEGNYNIAKFLVEQGSEVNNQNHNGNTALHYAVVKHFYNIADLLTKYGAREDIKNNKGLTPWECVEYNINF